ncbi:hypothetical protein Vi05172_g3138 [Venturia inaequalis]|nr:hypothetical protein Vi05172_g3138 [Venturia inaequalis]
MEKEMVGEREGEGSGVLGISSTRDPGIWGFQTAGKHALHHLDVEPKQWQKIQIQQMVSGYSQPTDQG